MNLGQKIHARLADLGKNQVELAKFLGIDQAAISQWGKKTKPARKRWRAIAQFCGWGSVDEMLAGTEEATDSIGSVPAPPAGSEVDVKLLEFTIAQLSAKLPAMLTLPAHKRAQIIAAGYAFLSDLQKSRPSQQVDSQDFSQLLRILEATL